MILSWLTSPLQTILNPFAKMVQVLRIVTLCTWRVCDLYPKFNSMRDHAANWTAGSGGNVSIYCHEMAVACKSRQHAGMVVVLHRLWARLCSHLFLASVFKDTVRRSVTVVSCRPRSRVWEYRHNSTSSYPWYYWISFKSQPHYCRGRSICQPLNRKLGARFGGRERDKLCCRTETEIKE